MSEFYKFFVLEKKQFLSRNRVVAPSLRLCNSNLEHFTSQGRLLHLHSSLWLMKSIQVYSAPGFEETYPSSHTLTYYIYFYPSRATSVYIEIIFALEETYFSTHFGIRCKYSIYTLADVLLGAGESIQHYESVVYDREALPEVRETETVRDFYLERISYATLLHRGAVISYSSLYTHQILKLKLEINIDAYERSNLAGTEHKWWLKDVYIYETKTLRSRP